MAPETPGASPPRVRSPPPPRWRRRFGVRAVDLPHRARHRGKPRRRPRSAGRSAGRSAASGRVPRGSRRGTSTRTGGAVSEALLVGGSAEAVPSGIERHGPGRRRSGFPGRVRKPVLRSRFPGLPADPGFVSAFSGGGRRERDRGGRVIGAPSQQPGGANEGQEGEGGRRSRKGRGRSIPNSGGAAAGAGIPVRGIPVGDDPCRRRSEICAAGGNSLHAAGGNSCRRRAEGQRVSVRARRSAPASSWRRRRRGRACRSGWGRP